MEQEHDSKDELYFSWWCEELKERGIIENFTRCESYELNNGLIGNYTFKKVLKTKTVNVEKKQTLIPIKVYTPDFKIVWNIELSNKFQESLLNIHGIELTKPFIVQGYDTSIVEIKPQFDQNNMTRLFKTNQAIMWDKHNIYVNMIVYQKLFEDTFTPTRFLLTTKTLKARKIEWEVRTLDEFLQL